MKNIRTMTICRASAGSGKTFTLAAYYVARLLSGVPFRSILAVTFTNKATGEMKERILTYLYRLGQNPDLEKDFLQKVQGLLADWGASLSADEVSKRSMCLFYDILSDYDNLRVSTIDSFLQMLLTGMVQSLGKAAGFSVDLDVTHAITTAVDQVMSTHIDSQAGLLDTVSDYLEEQLKEEKKWDIRRTLVELSEELFKESVQRAEESLLLDKEAIKAFKSKIGYKSAPCFVDMYAALDKLSHINAEEGGLKGGSNYYKALQRVRASAQNKKVKKDDWFRCFTEKQLEDLESPAFNRKFTNQSQAEELRQAMLRVHGLCDSCKQVMLNWRVTSEHLNNLMLLGYVRNQIDANLGENNTVLLANTAKVLRQALMPGDADFILEKAGIRYHHIMLDEFQDTSSLQWENFLHLIQEILSGGGTTLIVGDIKQSIYRWRNGDWRIMAGLDANHEQLGAFYNDLPLSRNFRSREEVVRFNLETMARLMEMNELTEQAAHHYDEGFNGDNLDDYYVSKKKGGYVRFRAYPFFAGRKSADCLPAEEMLRHDVVKSVMAHDMFDTMEGLLQRGADAGDMLILVRNKKELTPIVEAFRVCAEDGEHELLAKTKLVSSDSFQLESSMAVQAVMNALKYLYLHDSVALRYVKLTYPNADLQALRNLDCRMPLYDLMEEVIRLCLCPEGEYKGEDIAYINSLKDKTRDYVSRYGSNAKEFLAYWEDKMKNSAIPAAPSDDIRVLTIHSAKGLEAKHLFIPYCSWSMEDERGKIWTEAQVPTGVELPKKKVIPVDNSIDLREAGYAAAYDDEHAEQRVDNINLLYVALTRAADNLYIYSDILQGNELPDHVGSLLLRSRKMEDALQQALDAFEEDKPCFAEYEVGEPYLVKRSDTASDAGKPFTFSHAEILNARFFSENRGIRFRQSQDSHLYSVMGNAAGEKMSEMAHFGTICHDIFAKMSVREDADRVINEFYLKGIIDSEEQLQEVRDAIATAWNNAQMCDWFSGNWELMREDAILFFDARVGRAKEKRPDRVMIRGSHAIVLDYKFGRMHEEEYTEQVQEYMRLMTGLGYTEVEGYIWHASSQTLYAIPYKSL